MTAFRRRLALATAITAVAGAVASCVANPGPAPTVEPTPATQTTSTTSTTPTEPKTTRTEVSVGVDPLRNGLNPHLLADTSALVDSIAELVLPSAFQGDQLNTDLLETVEEVAPDEPRSPGDSDETTVTASEAPGAEGEVVQRIRYEIRPEAQWSDGTPITGTDFTYLWQALNRTPGVIEPAGYRAISEIRTTNAGRTVEVDFAERVDDYRDLFSNLLPSHLADDGGHDFSTAFFADIGAGGGRFLIDSVDRARGVIVLHRNDRFWGENPAELDILRLRSVNSVTQGVDLLRSGQVAFVDQVPSETMVEAYQLLPGAQTRLVDGPRTLHLDLNTASDTLATAAMREQLVRLIDVPLIARQAAGRSSHLDVPEHVDPPGPEAEAPRELVEATADTPLRIGADPADHEASAAVRAIADLMARYGIKVEIVATDIPSSAGTQLPTGELDAVITRARTDGSRGYLASQYQCPGEKAEAPRSANLSGYCAADGDKTSRRILSGDYDEAQARESISRINAREWLTVPLLGERRVVVLGEGIVGQDEDFGEWTSGFGSAATWRLEDEQD